MLSAFILPHADAPQAWRKAVFLNKLVISAVLDYATLVKHAYAVALLYCGQSVSYHDTGAFQPFKRVGYGFLGDVVQCSGRFVEHQYTGLRCDCASFQNPLPLTAGDTALTLGYKREHSHRHTEDIIVEANGLKGDRLS